MSGSKLELCKATLELLLRELRSCDRFGLITFSDDARLDIPTRKLTAEGKQAALDKIKRLRTRGCTNISGGIGMAIQDIKSVESPNEVRSVLLLTDGLANRGISDSQGIVDLTKGCLQQIEGNAPIVIHTFGYGSDHNAKLLRDITQSIQGGSYYFVEKDSEVASAFGDALGGILSVVAQNATVTIKIPPEAALLGVDIIDVHHEHKSKQPDGSYKVNLGDFYAEESRDVLFEVTLASGSKGNEPFPHAQCSISYLDTIQKCLVDGDTATASIARPSGSEISASNLHIAVQWLRIRATMAMKEADILSRDGNLELARSKIRECLEEIRTETTEGAQSDPLIIQLIGDLNDSLAGLSSRSVYAESGEMFMQNKWMSHAAQRCAESTFTTGNTYRGSRKMAKAKKFWASTN
uniref:VWFA domain-containing protein n=2 Tax=Pseudictyota dubia TaxID=2749911 RepID=A0A7R9WEV9_9STRA|mmetsp:Transcript_47649/g.88414  ORF Transcript_47649/g.88414 Transcript_47649/m.88414 type:complete len:409 (+) Transcript_47649:333-1559(+)